MVGKRKNIQGSVANYLMENEGKEVTANQLMAHLAYLDPCKKQIVSALSRLYAMLDDLYRVEHGVYIYHTTETYKEFEGHYNTIIKLAAANNGMITLEQVIESCRTTPRQARTMLDQLKYGRGYAPKNVDVQRVSYYHIDVKETADA